MDVNDMTFGCEFEIVVPSTVRVSANGTQVIGLPAGWIAKTDGSIRCGAGYKGIEIVSPVLTGANGIDQVKLVCDWMASIGAQVNESTGFHVHVGFDRNNAAGLKRLIGMVANHEAAIFATTGLASRANNRFCRSVRQSADVKAVYDNGLPSYLDRYHVLNCANLCDGRKPTVEFRAFAGTINSTKALGHVRMAIGFVQRACSETRGRKFGRQYPASCTNGQAAVKRMFKFLGWIGSETSTVWGGIETESAPNVKATVKELLHFAKEFDTQLQPVQA
jgi:hypothetical protein